MATDPHEAEGMETRAEAQPQSADDEVRSKKIGGGIRALAGASRERAKHLSESHPESASSNRRRSSRATKNAPLPARSTPSKEQEGTAGQEEVFASPPHPRTYLADAARHQSGSTTRQ